MEDKIYAGLAEIFREVFDIDDFKITSDTMAGDVSNWDSLNHIRMVLEVEKYFDIRFDTAEVASQRDVGAFVDLIKFKLK